MSSEVPEPDTHPRVTHSTFETRVWSNPQAANLALKILDKIRGTFGPGPLVRPIASTPARHTQGHRGQPGRTGCCRRCGAEPAGTGRYRRPFHCPMSHWGIGCQPAVKLQIAAEDFVRWPPKTPAGSRTTAGRLSTAVRCRVSPIHESAMAANFCIASPTFQVPTAREATLGSLNPKGNVQRANLAGRVAFLRLKRRDGKNWSAIVSGASCMGRRLPPARLSTASRWTASTLDKLGGAVFSAGLVPPPDSPQLDRFS